VLFKLVANAIRPVRLLYYLIKLSLRRRVDVFDSLVLVVRHVEIEGSISTHVGQGHGRRATACVEGVWRSELALPIIFEDKIRPAERGDQ